MTDLEAKFEKAVEAMQDAFNSTSSRAEGFAMADQFERIVEGMRDYLCEDWND